MRALFFHHGDTQFESNDYNRSMWRETSFAFHLLRQSINPPLSIDSCLRNWPEISRDLAEGPRKRGLQLNSDLS